MEDVDKIIDGIIENEVIAPLSNIDDIDEELLSDYIIETKEHVVKIEMAALNLGNGSEQTEELNLLFREFHTIKGLAGFVNQFLVQQVAHETETLLDYCRKGKIIINNEMVKSILRSADFIKQLCEDLALNNASHYSEMVISHVTLLSQTIANYSEINTNTTGESLPPLDEAYKVEEFLNGGQDKHLVEDGIIRIQVQKIDNLVDMVGELIINQSLIEQKTFEKFDSNDVFSDHVLRVSRLLKGLQNLSLSLRMVSLKSTFQKLRRIAHNITAETGKNVKLISIGEETEIDRSIADKLLDPLIHLIKNSFSHGIEEESVRLENGKPAQGTITVEAVSKKGNVYIVISDDGAGICTDVLFKKAVERHLFKNEGEYLKEDIQNVMFEPGFSTSKSIDNLSGRGVGMDVVKTELTKIGGKVTIVSQYDGNLKLKAEKICPCVLDELNCKKGKGLDVTLKIPINMAIMNGTIVDISGTKYILPTLQVKKIFKPVDDQWVSVRGVRNIIRMREEIISVVPISETFGLENFSLDECIIVVVEQGKELRALPVSSIVDKRDIVVKSLGECFDSLQYAAGASILGDGKVAIILDIDHLFKIEEVK